MTSEIAETILHCCQPRQSRPSRRPQTTYFFSVSQNVRENLFNIRRKLWKANIGLLVLELTELQLSFLDVVEKRVEDVRGHIG